MKVIFDHRVDEAANIATFYFKPEQSVRYTAGQFVELTLVHENPDDRGIKRWFTLSSSPTEELLSITTKFTATDGSSFKAALRNLSPGIELQMSEPIGDFVLPKLVQTPLIFVAGGIGITPFHSIFSWLASTHETRPIHFIYGVKSEEDIIFQPVFDRAGIHATVIVGEPSASWGGEHGNISAELILGLETLSDDTLIYVSGPEPMVNSLVKDLKTSGVQRQQIVTDGFSGYNEI